jgi:hypothetical protein
VAEKRKLEYFLLRYVPDAVKGEFVNFGLVAVEDRGKARELIDVRFTRDWGRVRGLDPQADVDVLEKLQAEIRQEIGRILDQATLWKRMQDSFSNLIQVSPVLVAASIGEVVEEVADVARIYLESPKAPRTREPAGRQKILETMRDEFEKAGVLGMLRAVPAEPYTKAGDPFEFDFGYNTGKEIKLFQAVSMRASVDSAVMLAARYPKIAPVMAQMTSTIPLLTAVVEEGLDLGRDEVRFAVEMMEESSITVAEVKEMPEIAKVARRELGA